LVRKELMDERELESISQQEDEDRLVQAARANPAAFEGLYSRYSKRVYRYLYARVNSHDEALDLTQQVFLKALDALPSYRSRGGAFAAWLFSIASHIAADTYRRRKPTLSWEALTDLESPGEFVDEQNPEALVLHQEELKQLQRQISRLDQQKRELLALRFAAGLSSTEIASVVGKSPAAVKKQLTRIIQTLKEQYHEEETA